MEYLAETPTLEETLLISHVLTFVGFGLALLITGRVILERQSPSNIFAWSLFVFFIPWLGVPAFLLFGGRKARRLVRHKRSVQALAVKAMNKDTRGVVDIQPERSFKGNRFELHPNGEDAFHTLCNEIDQARSHIHIMTYILTYDSTGRAIMKRLTRKVKEGVEVRVLVDALGSLGRIAWLVKDFKEAGGQFARFMPVAPFTARYSANLRNHRKIAIFDGKRAIVGGQNIDTRFMGANANRKLFVDFNAGFSGPAVAAFNRTFVSDWCFASGDRPEGFRELLAMELPETGVEDVEVMTSGPDVDHDSLWERILLMIQEARESLTIVTPYFVPDNVLLESLIVKAKAGYEVKLLLPQKSNHRLVDFARGHNLRRLHEAGAKILLYTPRMMHAKLILVDNHTAMMGSPNLDNRSLFLNFEVGVFLTTPRPVAELQAWVQNIEPDCIPFETSVHAQAGESRRLVEDFAHLLKPLL